MPPQHRRIRQCYRHGGGREAVANAEIEAGELVMVAGPYIAALFSSAAPCALLCAAKANCSEEEVEGGAPSNDEAHTKKSKGYASKFKSKPAGKRNSAGGGADVDAHLLPTDTLGSFGLGEGPLGGREGLPLHAAAHDSAVYTLRYPGHCASCFQSIPVGTVLLNRARLRETATDISVEQMLLQQELNVKAGGKAEAPSGKLNKVKPAAGKGRAVKERLAASAEKELEQFMIAYCREKQKRERERQQLPPTAASLALSSSPPRAPSRLLQGGAFWSDPVGHIGIWEEEEKKNDTNDRQQNQQSSVKKVGCCGCEHCGVPLLCSRTCWKLFRAHHVESGECSVLRRIHFPLMQHYFAVSGKGTSGVGANGGLVPGTEPSRWAFRCSPDRELEMHSLLLAALAAGRAQAEGCGERLRVEEKTFMVNCGDQRKPKKKEKEGEQAPAGGGEAGEATLPSDAHPFTIEALRTSLDALDAVVEVADEVRGDGSILPLVFNEKEAVEGEAAMSAACAAWADGTTKRGEVSWDAREDFYTPEDVEKLRLCYGSGDTAGPADVAVPSQNRRRQLLQYHLLTAYHLTTQRERDHSCTVTDTGALRAPSPPLGVRCQALPLPSYDDYAHLVTNLSSLPKDRVSLYHLYWRQFAKRVKPLLGFRFVPKSTRPPTSSSLNHSPNHQQQQQHNGEETIEEEEEDGDDGVDMSESYFMRLLAACQCNSFGMFSPDDVCIASGLYPEASLFNHSCAPNLCRVMRPGRAACFYALRRIQRGEPLCICYTDVQESSTAERRRLILEAYRFLCQCPRCQGVSESARRVGVWEQSLCEECDAKGYQRLLWFKDNAQTDGSGREAQEAAPQQVTSCSVCRRRALASRSA